jgi:hypothetical protein
MDGWNMPDPLDLASDELDVTKPVRCRSSGLA